MADDEIRLVKYHKYSEAAPCHKMYEKGNFSKCSEIVSVQQISFY